MPSTFPLQPSPDERHVVCLLRERARRAPGSRLLSCGGAHRTAEDLLAAGARRAATWREAGLVAGDRVAVQCGNRIDLVELLVAAGLAGVVLVPLNTASRGEQLAYYLRNCRARVFITEPGLLPHLLSAHAIDAASIDAVEHLWALDSCEAPAALPRLTRFPLVAEADPADWTPAHPGAAAIVMYTSGTSGPSKGVVCSHAQLFWWGHHSLVNIGIDAQDVLYTCLPLFHINALNTFFQALVGGGRMVIGGRFSVTHFFADLAQAEATVTYLLGAMIPMLLSRAPDATERAHRVRVALAPSAQVAHYDAFEGRTGIRMLDGFGSTESNFVICSGGDTRRPGWMGRLAAGFQARIVDAHDNPVPDGTPGELVLRSDEPYAFSSGYFEMPEKTVEAWRNLWFHTGDRVVRDADGYYRFLDRMKDSIRRRGENISSFEVEQALGSHPAVADVAAYAVPSDLAEDEVMVAVVPQPGQQVEPLALIRWCEDRLPYFAIPRFVRLLADLPKTENGKVQKYKLRADARTPDTWDLVASGHTVKR